MNGLTKWLHFNRWVDGTHHIKTCDTREEAYASMVEFIGHEEYPYGDNSLRSDDGDHSFIVEEPVETIQRAIQGYTNDWA